MSVKRPIWNFFKKTGFDMRAICLVCKSSFSYKSTTGNLRYHLKKVHPDQFLELENGGIPSSSIRDEDEDSNSSIKFSSEIWNHFEMEGSVARCSLCQQTLDNTVEEMKQHLEEDHPAVMIGILHNKSTDPAADSDDEKVQEEIAEEETFTEVVYLEDETKKKHTMTINPLKRSKPSRPIMKKTAQDRPKIITEYKVIPQAVAVPKEAARPEIDSFLNYVGVLLRNVPKDSLPKLQLDVISLILNAQMANTNTNSTILDVSNVVNTTGDYHITIEKDAPSERICSNN